MCSIRWYFVAAISAFWIVVFTVDGTTHSKKQLGFDQAIRDQYRKIHPRKLVTEYPKKKAMKDKKYIDQYNKGMHNGRAKRATTGQTMAQLVPSFDWRHMGSNCQSLIDVRYQKCGDCWAVSAIDSLADRYCLATGQNRFFSEWDVIACLKGCEGGTPEAAMDYYVSNGLTSGGDPDSSIPQPSGCFPSVNVADSNSCPQSTCKVANQTSTCSSTCSDNSPLDTSFGHAASAIYPSDFADIAGYVNATMWELFNHGPGVVIMAVYSDFYDAELPYSPIDVTATYMGPKPGATLIGWHAIRLIGWGTDANGTDYWTIMNQWGNWWGNNGAFNIKRGVTADWGVDHSFDFSYPREMYN